MSWLRLFPWRKAHLFKGGRAVCGNGAVPLMFKAWQRPPVHLRCLQCLRRK